MESATASVRNCIRMSCLRAPTAMRRPISRVRSVTETIMMFMMPMPPTMSDTDATAARSSDMVREDSARDSNASTWLRIQKSFSWLGRRRCLWRSSSRISFSAIETSSGDRTFTAIALTSRPLSARSPNTFFRAGAIGIMTRSSWSHPPMEYPLACSTPATLKGTRLMRMTEPVGSWPGKRFWATVLPTSTTLELLRNSSAAMLFPLSRLHSRASKYSGVTPMMRVVQFWLPEMTCAQPRM